MIVSARRSLSSEDWYSNLDNLLKHCGDGRIVSVGNATANEIKQKVHQYIEQETKLSPDEREQFQRLNQYLAYFDEGASDDKNYKAAKSASKALLSILKWAYEKEQDSALTTWVTALLNELRGLFDSGDWRKWRNRVSAQKSDEAKNRIRLENPVVAFLEERQKVFGEQTRQGFLDKLGQDYEVCRRAEIEAMNLMIQELKNSKVQYQNMLNHLQQAGVLDDTTRKLVENGIKIKKGQKYRIANWEPVQDGKNRVIEGKLRPIEPDSDLELVSPKRLKE
jgi:hypothetical protein|tara:strand:- start:3472 stop:4308 length:837 start_codon:yes stop_codon:yes gene_type:complete